MNIATSADGYVARPDGNLDWLTERPAPKGFYGLPEFERSTDAKILGRKTFDRSLEMGARFSAAAVHYVFSRRTPPGSVPAGVQFVSESIRTFAEGLRAQAGKNVNAIILEITSAIVPGFFIRSFFSALIGAILLTLVNMLLKAMVGEPERAN